MKAILGTIFMTALSSQFAAADPVTAPQTVELGQFSVSMGVKDIQKSFEFYQKLGFEKIVGDIAQKWLILRNSTNNSVIGLFQDGREGIGLTFNPLDVRNVQQQLKTRGIAFDTEASGSAGPGFAYLKDPDGHVILLDQH
ncbi:MAG: VOC family protein [Bdellovibrionales bacterium]|nr:VOC family protein [Bdellovibrionales bacterium]